MAGGTACSTAPLYNSLLTTASTAASPAFRDNRFFQWICVGVVAILAITAYHPDKVFDWALENGCVAITLIALFGSYRKMAFSDLSYLLMLVYLCIHEYGAHYKYSDVPLGEWIKPLLHTTRNHYDRISHFSFGLLLAYPMREIAMRKLHVTGKWLYYLPVECVLAISAIYEMLEAYMATILTPERGEEFVGMQGDMWDSQEDMFVAGLGAVVGVLIIAAFVSRRNARRAQDNSNVDMSVDTAR
jgi:putative membrane protein